MVLSYLLFSLSLTADAIAHVPAKPSTFEFCLPTMAAAVPDHPVFPDHPVCLHEVKYDGYRLRLERDGDRVRLITRGGYN